MEIYNSKRLYYNSENKQQNKKITDTLLVCSLWASCLANFKIMRQCVFGLGRKTRKTCQGKQTSNGVETNGRAQ